MYDISAFLDPDCCSVRYDFFLSLFVFFSWLDLCFCFYQIKGRYGPDLDSLAGGPSGHLVGIMVDDEARLHLLVNGVDQGVAAKEIPPNPYVVLDLYGQCQEVGFYCLLFVTIFWTSAVCWGNKYIAYVGNVCVYPHVNYLCKKVLVIKSVCCRVISL